MLYLTIISIAILVCKSHPNPLLTVNPSLVQHNDHLLRVALGVEDYRAGSFTSVLDQSLFPRPQRFKRRSTSSSSAVASRHHVQYPVNVYVGTDSTLFISAFRSNQVFRVKEDGNPELFARGTYCNTRSPCIQLNGPWGLTGHANELFVASWSTDTILIFDQQTSNYLGNFGDSEELNAPEGLSVRDGLLYVASYLNGEIVRYDIATRRKINVVARNLPGPEGIEFFAGSTLLAVACHTDHSVRILDISSNSNGNSYTNSNSNGNSNSKNATATSASASTSASAAPGKEVAKITNSMGGGNWTKPIGVATSHGNLLYISALQSNRSDALLTFEIIQSDNYTFAKFKNVWEEMPELKAPAGIAVSRDSMFVASYQSHRVLVYTMNETDGTLRLKASLRL